MGLLQLLSANELFVQILNFLVLLFLLRLVGWKKVLAALEQRRNKIAADFEEIERKKQDMAQVKTDYETKLKEIDQMAKVKIQEAADEGQRVSEEIKREALKQSDKILAETKIQIKVEFDKAKVELKGQVVDLVIQATEQVIDEKLSAEGDRRLVEKFLVQLDEKA